MAAVETERLGFVPRTIAFGKDVIAELKRITWPDRKQVYQLSIGVVGLTLVIGFLIFILDLVLRLILVSGIPKLFGGGA